MRLVPSALAVTAAFAACRIDLDHRAIDATDNNARLCEVSENVQSCLSADQATTLTDIQAQILEPKCAIVGTCHDGGQGYLAGNLDFRSVGSAYASLVNQPSMLDSTRVLVVPGSSAQSFLSVMIGQIKPSEADPVLAAIPNDPNGNVVGTMPQGAGSVLCCQKLDAIATWINAGAAMN